MGWGSHFWGRGAGSQRFGEGMLRAIRDSGREFRRNKDLGRGDKRYGEGFLGTQRFGEGVLRVVGESGGGKDLRRGSKIWGRGAGSQGFWERVLRVVRIRGGGFGGTRIWEGGSNFGKGVLK